MVNDDNNDVNDTTNHIGIVDSFNHFGLVFLIITDNKIELL